MRRELALAGLALGLAAACGADDVRTGNPRITVEVDGVDAQADARKIAAAATDACDVGAVEAVGGPPDGVDVTVEFPDGDTDEVVLDCDTGELVRR